MTAIAAKGRAARAGLASSRSLYQPLDWVLVRAPLLPVEAYLCLCQDSLQEDPFPQASPSPFRRDALGAVAQDSQSMPRPDPQPPFQQDLRPEPRAGTSINEAFQRLLAANPAIAAAVAVGSPSLFDALQRSGVSGEDGARRAAKLLRYLIRMSTRPQELDNHAATETGDHPGASRRLSR